MLRLTASDSALSTSDDIVITVNPAPPVNQPPVVNAGPDQTITLPAAANLVGDGDRRRSAEPARDRDHDLVRGERARAP